MFLVVATLAMLVLVVFVSAVAGYHSGMEEIERLFDSQLQDQAHLASGIDAARFGAPGNVTGVALQRWKLAPGQAPRLLAHAGDIPGTAVVELEPGFGHANFGGRRWRTYVHFAGPGEVVVAAARTDLRYRLAENVIIETILPVVLWLPVCGLLVWFIVGHGLRPLDVLAARLHGKAFRDLSAVSLDPCPKEIEPVRDAVNRLLGRLEGAFEREKRFVADAAHELRTPIAVLRVQVHNARERLPAHEAELCALEAAVERMQHLIEQILILHRLSPEQSSRCFVALDLHALVQTVIVACYDTIEARRQQIELLADTAACERRAIIAGDRFALETLLRNLLGNASKYTPEEGHIRVSVSCATNEVLLRVEDDGPGIPASARGRIFERFHRIGGDAHASGMSGSGLGLAIVHDIVELHDARIEVDDSGFTTGVRFTVVFRRDGAGGS